MNIIVIMQKLLLFFLLLSFNSFANNTPKVVVDGAFYDWNVYYIDDLSGEKKCYIASFAKNTIGNYKKERNPYIMIAYFKARNAEEVSIFADYDYKLKSNVYVGIDNKQFRMFTKGKFAWAKNSAEDKTIIKEMLDAKVVKTRGETLMGEYTVDTYSTKGLARAYKRMRELCED